MSSLLTTLVLFVMTAAIPLVVSAGMAPSTSYLMWMSLYCACLLTLIGLLVLWLKRKLPEMDARTSELVQHVEMYNLDNAKEDEEMKKSIRRQQYLTLVENYYNLTTDIFHIIWGPHYSMGILFPTEGVNQWQTYPACQQMYQCYWGLSLGANEKMTIGDFGCGTGGPTRCIAQFTGANIKTVNITEYHLNQMKEWNKQEGLSDRIELIHSDYHHTPIESDSLDGVYMCESLAHSPDYNMLCTEVFRVLKPGAKFTGFNWELTEKFDENNEEHCRVRLMIERGVGVPQLVKMCHLTQALEQAGFQVLVQRDHSDFGEVLEESRGIISWREIPRHWKWCLRPRPRHCIGVFGLLKKIGMVAPGTTEAYESVLISLKSGTSRGS